MPIPEALPAQSFPLTLHATGVATASSPSEARRRVLEIVDAIDGMLRREGFGALFSIGWQVDEAPADDPAPRPASALVTE